MRWFVEISPLGTKSGQANTLVVEAPQWQPALQKARALRGDEGPLGNFSIELLEDGFRAIDPVARLRYIVKRAPEGTPLTEETGTAKAEPAKQEPAKAEPAKAEPAKQEPAKQEPAKEEPAKEEPDAPKKRPMAPTLAFGSEGAAAIAEANEDSSEGSGPATEPDVEQPALPSFQVLSSREEDPSDSSPLTYREYVYAVEAGTSNEDAHRLVIERFEDAISGLDAQRVGKLINLAVFDHVFEGKPQRRPLVTLTWKDWKNDEPEIRFPARDLGPVSLPPSAPTSVPAPAPAPETPTVPITTLSSAKPVALPKPDPTPEVAIEQKAEAPAKSDAKREAKSEAKAGAPVSKAAAQDAVPETRPVPTVASPQAAKSQPPRSKPVATPSKPPPAEKRHAGDDLLTELFEASGDLRFARDALEGAEFVLHLVLEKLPSEVGVVSLFDMNKREFVIVRQIGGPRLALCARQPERAPLAIQAMRRRHAVLAETPDAAAKAMDDRWRAMGVELKSLMITPVELSGRFLGLIELANPIDGKPYTEGDSNALTFVGQQYAEFVASRGVIVDEEHIRGEAQPAPAAAPRSSGKRR